MKSEGNIVDVLNGNKPLKFEVGFDSVSLIWMGVTILVAVALAVIIAKKVS